VEKAAAIEPSPQMKDHIRYHLQLKMAHTGKPRRSMFRSWQPRWAIAVTAVLLVLLVGSGTVFAAGGSMPGNPLYAVKIATEDVHLSLTSSPVNKAELYATYADRRVVELGYLAEKGNAKAAEVEKIAKRYTYCVTQMGSLPLTDENDMAMVAAASTQTPMMSGGAMPPVGNSGTLNATVTAPSTTTATMTTIAAPATAVPAPRNSRSGKNAGTATTTFDSNSPAITYQTENESHSTEAALAKLTPAQRAHLLAYFYYLADSHPQELESFLSKFPEQDRPAIRRMIENAKIVYPEIVKKIQNAQDQSGK